MKLKGKVAIITGAGRGLGRASAVEMAKEGASVVILSRTPAEIKETESMVKATGGKALSLCADVSEEKTAEEAVKRCVSEFGRIDVLMNNAAVMGPVKAVFKTGSGEWDRTVDINLRAPYLFSKAVIPYMIKQGGGKIINVTSGLGEIVLPPFGVYSVTKAGLIHLTRIMAVELKAYNIQVNGLDPGVMDTRMQEDLRALGPEVLGEGIYADFVAMKETGELKAPEKVARLSVFLASSESDSFTGENGTEDHFRRFGYRG